MADSVVLQEEGITALVEQSGFIAVADTSGVVSFFNEELQRLKWVQNFTAGRVHSLSFHCEDETFERAEEGEAGQVVGNFLLSTAGPLCGIVSYSAGTLDTIINGKGAPWTFQDIHPTKNLVNKYLAI